jgi:hypothetical protein
MSDAELRDEITYARIHATTGTDMPLRRKFGRRLAELLGEASHREWVADGVPW